MVRPVANPPNPWASTDVEYLEEPPNAYLEVFEDHTRSLLAHNDSPDLGFDWSVNPYRGCFHACSYCLSGDTPVLMADGRTKPIGDLRAGDEIYGTNSRGRYRRYVKTRVIDHWSVHKRAYRVGLSNGTELITSGDHRLLTRRGWAHVTNARCGCGPRNHLTPHDMLLGVDSAPRVKRIEPVEGATELFDITTGTGDFISNGVISHNCYARPGHEYLSFGAGTDFDRKIVVKPQAPELLREAFDKKSWKGDLVVFSGVTDCYQPLEASYRLTRGCLEVCADYANPVGIITKSPLIERDIDVLVRLASVAHVGVTISVPFWEQEKARAMEPYVTTPARRIKTIERLAAAGLDVGVNVAPMIPGLGDEDMPKVLEAARAAGARRAGFVFLRLPGPVKDVFVSRLRETLPLRADKVLARVLDARNGKLNDPRFGSRLRGEGPYAEAAKALFDATARRLGLETGGWPEHASTFRRPPKRGDQLDLFDGDASGTGGASGR